MRITWILVLSIYCTFLQGCFAPLAAIGSSGTAAASSAGTAVAAAAIANPVTATSVASSVTTGKSPLEHAASVATKKECHFTNIVESKPICEDIALPTITDKSTPLPSPGDKTTKTPKQ